jgi:hypothetical protein
VLHRHALEQSRHVQKVMRGDQAGAHNKSHALSYKGERDRQRPVRPGKALHPIYAM